MDIRKLKYTNLIGYAVCIVMALVVGAALVRSGASLSLVLLLSASAWAGGIFFLLLAQTQGLEKSLKERVE